MQDLQHLMIWRRVRYRGRAVCPLEWLILSGPCVLKESQLNRRVPRLAINVHQATPTYTWPSKPGVTQFSAKFTYQCSPSCGNLYVAIKALSNRVQYQVQLSITKPWQPRRGHQSFEIKDQNVAEERLINSATNASGELRL